MSTPILKFIKKTLIVAMVNLLPVCSYAAIVSDNDGSAFVTKSEFEALKDGFNNQISQYNSSLDSKIDGAIASYLAGMNLAKPESISILISDWEKYTMLAGTISNQWVYPNFHGQFAYTKYTNLPSFDSNRGLYKTFYTKFSIEYKNTKTSNRRVLVDNVIIQATPDKSNATWAGVALNCTEDYTASRIDDTGDSGGDPGWLYSAATNYLYACQPLNITARNYISNWNSTSSKYWNVTQRWYYNYPSGSASGYVAWNSNPTNIVITPAVTYDKDASGNIYSYQHIGTWRNKTNFECSAKGVTNYITVSSNNTLETSGWLNQVTKSGKWSGMESKGDGGSPNIVKIQGQKLNQSVQFTDNNNNGGTNKAAIPTLGLLGNITSNAIYQYQDLYDQDGNKVDKITLEKGAILFNVKENEIVEWAPEFSNCTVSGMTGQKEVTLVFSYKPFTDKANVADSNDLVIFESGSSKNLTKVTTTDRKVKIKFESGRNSYVYCKWYPAVSDSDLDSKSWEATLDINKCNTYISIKQ